MSLSRPRRLVAVGLGCRRGVAARTIAALVSDCLTAHHATPVGFFTHIARMDEAGLIAAALRFGHPLDGLTATLLAERDDETLTVSALSREHYGLSSLSECAALAGAGRGSRLVAARAARDGVTVALAEVLP
ncbi:cobalamin biosynthesis protein [Segnochrobactraceae bacterium EtOH-i3]